VAAAAAVSAARKRWLRAGGGSAARTTQSHQSRLPRFKAQAGSRAALRRR
jgi:hypothetical protein